MLARLLARLALGRPIVVILVGLVIAVAGIGLATKLALQTDLAELLPQDAPSVVELKRLQARVGGTGNVAIAIESGDGTPVPLRAYVPKLAEALRSQLGTDLLSIRYTRAELSAYYTKFAAWYVPLEEMRKWSQRVAEAVAKQNPAYVELDPSEVNPMDALARDVRAAKQKLEPKNASDPETGLLMSEGGRLAVIFLRPASDSLDLGGSRGMLERIQKIVDSTSPQDHGVKVLGYTGSIPTALTEVEAIRDDIVNTALLVALGVGAVVMLYFRGLRELLLMSGAVVVGVAAALGFAELWIGHVNAQTAFLGAIIAGTGINYGIILLDRYRHARQVQEFEAALETSIAHTLRATGIAALATAVSFGVLAAGRVESFHQFGWIGGIGILACWLTTFTVVPAFVVLVDRKRGAPKRSSGGGRRVFEAVARMCSRSPRTVLAAVVVMTLGSVYVGIDARGDIVETDLRKLGTKSSETSGIQKLDNRLRTMDDRSSTPAVIATATRADTRPLCDVLNQRARTDLNNILLRCYSIDDLYPRDVADRQPLIDRLRRNLNLVDEDDLNAADRADVTELRRALAQAPPTDRDLPHELEEIFIERDGSLGRLAFVEPRNEHVEENLYKFTDAIRSVPLPSGKVVESSGELVVFADVLRAMRRDAVVLTIAAAVLVLVVLALVQRHVGAFFRVAFALVAGVTVMIGVAIALGEKLNFFNFVALPTTFGIGIDYAINIEERIRQYGRAHMVAAVGESGPPVVLASLTSTIGYASLLVADSRALSSFGALAIVGEVACVVIALLVIPALWSLGAGERDPAREEAPG